MSRARDVHPTSVYVEQDGPRVAIRSRIGHLEQDGGVWGFGDRDDGYLVEDGGVLGIDTDATAHDVRVIALPGRILIYGE